MKKRIYPIHFFILFLAINLISLSAEEIIFSQGDTNEEAGGAELPYSIMVVTNGEEKPLSANDSSEGMKSNRRTDVIYRNRIQLENNEGTIWSVIDPVEVSPKLDITSQRGEVVPGQETWFKIYSNYREFIKRWEIILYDDHGEEILDTLKGEEIDFSREIPWIPTMDSHEKEEIFYRLKVWDSEGNFDETRLKPLRIVNKERWEKNSAAEKRGERALDGGEAFGGTSLSIQNIPIDASRVRIYGHGFPDKTKILMGEREIPVDSQGKFVVEEHFSPGPHILDLKIVRNEKVFSYPMEISVPDRYNFIVGIADIKGGKNRVSGSDEIIAKDYHYDGSSYTDGRVAFYSKNKYKKYLLTAQMDTHEEELKNIFSNMDERENTSVFRDMERDMYYTTYGDESTTYSDVNTQGKFYLKLSWDKNNLTWGNYNTGFTGTEFANYNRSLYGAKADLRSRKTTMFGEDQGQLKVFLSQPGTVFAHDSFLGTGGSLYYLKHTDVVTGSEKIWVEVKDSNTGLVTDNIYLDGGEDYEIDYFQGRVILSRPLLQILQDSDDTSIIKDGAMDGKETYLMVDYEYYPVGIEDDDLSGGIRGGRWFTEGIYTGGTYVEGNDNDLNYTLKGTHMVLRKSKDTFLRAEIAESQGREGGSKFYSDDGGLSFREVESSSSSQDGRAYSLKGRARLSDLNSRLSENTLTEGWYRKKERGFSISSLEDDREETNYGVRTTYRYSKKLKLNLYYDYAESREKEKELQEEIGIKLHYKIKKFLLSTEVKESREEDSQERGEGVLAGVRGEYFFTPSTSVYSTLQGTLYREHEYDVNDMVTLGGRSKLGDKLGLNLESSWGSRGDSVLGGLDYALGENHDVYVNYLLSEDRSERDKTLTFGQKAKLGKRYSVYQENQFVHGDTNGRGLIQSYGLDFDATEKLRTGISYQQGDLDKDEDKIKRRSVSLYSSYDARKLFLRNKIEYRRDKGSSEKKHQWLTVNRIKYILDNEWTFKGKGNLSYTKDEKDQKEDAKFVELSLGFAYRPIWNDRLNILSKYTYLYDLPSEGQDDSSTDEKAHIIAIEELYDIDERWTIGSKVAIKKSMLRDGRDEGEWFSNTTELYAVKTLYHVIQNWDIMGEYHWLVSRDSNDMSQGCLASVQYHVNTNMKVGVGYNFTSFDDDLTDDDYDAEGWFINLIGKL